MSEEVSLLDTAGQGGGIWPGVSRGGQQWGEVIRGVCAASLTLPDLSGEGEDKKESQMAGPVQISFL